MTRKAKVERKTNETQIVLEVNLDGAGTSDVSTGVGFFDHMLDLLARHSAIDLTVKAKGDLEVDQHHTVEDTGICLGRALAEALGDKSGIRRYGQATVPMDETLASAAVDFGGRPYFVFRAEMPTPTIGQFDSQLVAEFWQAVATNALCNLHIEVHYSQNSHHTAEGIFKAAARAIRMAVEADPRMAGVPSTKGTL